MVYALVSDEVAQRLEAGAPTLRPQDWKSGEKVRLGVQAPRDIPIFRKEVYLEIQQQRLEAGTSAREEVDEALKRLSGD